jgi:D-glycero-D-manno-heptose 1,7-bisphosphate phosphatase
MGGASKRRAVFIDRDGTISEEVGYVNHPARYRVFPYAAEAIKLLNEAGWLAVLVTNQAGVARGYFTEDVIGAVHALLVGRRAALPLRLRLSQAPPRPHPPRRRRSRH